MREVYVGGLAVKHFGGTWRHHPQAGWGVILPGGHGFSPGSIVKLRKQVGWSHDQMPDLRPRSAGKPRRESHRDAELVAAQESLTTNLRADLALFAFGELDVEPYSLGKRIKRLGDRRRERLGEEHSLVRLSGDPFDRPGPGWPPSWGG